MPIRRILLLGDPMLRQISRPVSDLSSAAPILTDLRDTLAEFRRTHGFGRGISAVQIGEPIRIIYLEVDGQAYEIVNPVFVGKSAETFELWDDCFSFPDLLVRLRRSVEVRLRYWSPDGEQHELDARDSLSELVQHEMDHLEGILAIDHAIDRNSLAVREEWKRQYQSSPVFPEASRRKTLFS